MSIRSMDFRWQQDTVQAWPEQGQHAPTDTGATLSATRAALEESLPNQAAESHLRCPKSKNASPEYPCSATVDVCHHPLDSGQITQVTAVASFPPDTFSTCCSNKPEFHLPSCGLLTLHHKPSAAFYIFQSSWMHLPCKCLSTYFACSEGTSASVERYRVRLRPAGDLTSDWETLPTTLPLGFFLEQC